MIRLQSFVLTRLLSSPSASPLPSLHRLLSTAVVAAPQISPNPGFAVADYLVETCGLTRPQALKASKKLSHLKSPSNPDAVLAFLAGLGLSSSDVAALVAKDPKFLCAGVGAILEPNVVELTGLGLSHSEIARLVSLEGSHFRIRSIVSKLSYYLPLFGSPENLLRALRTNSYLLTSSLDKVIDPNRAFLRECGLADCDIAKLCTGVPWILTAKAERIRSMVKCAEAIGVPRGSKMFRHALHAIGFQSEDALAAKVEYLKNTFRWSEAEAGIAVSKAPTLLARSKDTLQSLSEFLISEVGLEPAYIAHRAGLLTCSLEGRIRSRYYVLNFLKANGLLKRELSCYSAVMMSEKLFMKRIISPHKEALPQLAEDYAAACRGEMPTNFRLTWTQNGL
ncbi:uncharacterized protein LOC100828826 [Brachypodium distachyon]|uniref:Uncharacterized protein n=1 Tax=Brachypodium distachyon TaxID=15368 RepID=I1H3Z6_BRADI|nr:uncharacterized protein LOC100828826 [Brachypodium distachyon]KQK21020.1 hypothetical protein BRADI_1g58197v3 [Brachypodium distachyon]KQK21021.1 hypothetical protein BRADI_1g58197v3 [Brachypodium distachyon]|eukprot:XP_010228424.1 uncharacterized protein LOC100828826 [Brachypodium distachyon]